MKRLILIVSFFGITLTNAQVNIGIKAGYNLSRVTGDWEALLEDFLNVNLQSFNINPEFDPKFRSGFNAGLFAEIKLSENFYLQPEALYCLKGVKFNDTFDFQGEFGGSFVDVDGEYNYGQKLNYLEIPVLAKYKSRGGFVIFAGPYVAFLLSAGGEVLIEANINTNFFGFPINGPQEFTQDGLQTEDFNTIDFGIAAGLGYEFPFGFGIDARYVKGMINISKDLEDEMFTNSSIQVGVSYKIAVIGKKE